MASTWESTPAPWPGWSGGFARACPLPIIAKLTPNVTDIVPIAAAAAEAGADAVSLINTVRGMAVDWRRRRPILAYDVGGLSGPAIKPIALRMVWEVARALPGLPIIGIGGIATADDALEFLVAGASAVQVGTATFYDPTASERLLDDLTRRLEEADVPDVRQIVGTLSVQSGLSRSGRRSTHGIFMDFFILHPSSFRRPIVRI